MFKIANMAVLICLLIFVNTFSRNGWQANVWPSEVDRYLVYFYGVLLVQKYNI